MASLLPNEPALRRSFWSDTSDASGTPENLQRLLDNQVPAIREPKFFSAEMCAAIVEAAQRSGLDLYEGVTPPIGKVGITQFEHGATEGGREAYLAQVERANRMHRLMLHEMGLEPLQQMAERLERMGARNLAVAREHDGRLYFAGLVREMGADGALLHFDYAPFDAGQAWVIGRHVKQQLAVNVYLSDVPAGGECLVYNRQWQPDDEHRKIAGSYGYHKQLVDGAQVKVLAPHQGDLTLFNSRNFHEVRGLIATPDRPLSTLVRFTLSFFVGKIDNDHYVMWS